MTSFTVQRAGIKIASIVSSKALLFSLAPAPSKMVSSFTADRGDLTIASIMFSNTPLFSLGWCLPSWSLHSLIYPTMTPRYVSSRSGALYTQPRASAFRAKPRVSAFQSIHSLHTWAPANHAIISCIVSAIIRSEELQAIHSLPSHRPISR